MDKEIEIKRGNILYANMSDEYEGSIQGGMRPVVVISNNQANKYSPVITVIPLTSRIYKKKYLPTHVWLRESHCSGLGRDSVALCEQILPLNRKDIVDFVGEVDQKMMKKITRAIQIQVGVYEEYN